ncbi:uncharacterized protein N7484_007623 [Penicillium longicatenatum]|uniref:uncharacterized protein n=1 Tax=Penicillium longicatenatum TaxID=1561947 RepID=UPI002547F5B5|nr:uncharacterized protein N7484_007623 [Penicillium longicatenatum]KAJ5639761.1 hypothetical protein N7484_007623 [Penicillium longicatenatum]
MAQSQSALLPVILIPPLLDQAFGVPEPTMILRDCDDLPPFTLILDWKCPACSEDQPYAAYKKDSEPDEHSQNHQFATSFPLMELRYIDQPRYLIWPAVTASEEYKDLFTQSMQLLASKCEYAAQWQPGMGQKAYLKVVPGPIMSPVQDLAKYEVPLFFIRPSKTVWDRIDAKIIFFEREQLPSICILLNPPSDECFMIHDVEEGHEEFMQDSHEGDINAKEPPEYLQENLDSQNAQANAVLAPNPALDNSMQLFIAGVPDPTLRHLAVYAFRILRCYKIHYLHTTLLRSYLKDERIWDTDIWKVPKYRDSIPLCTAQWWDPERTIDSLNGPFRGRQTELLHLKHLNPKELLKLLINHYTFLDYEDLDMSASSTQFRLIECDISKEHEVPMNWNFHHTALVAEECPSFCYIYDFASDSPDARPQCEIICLNGREVAIPVSIIATLKDLMKETERSSESVAKFYFFLQHLCVNTASRDEFNHHEPLYPRIRDQAKSSTFTLMGGNCSSLLKVRHQGSFYSPLKKDIHQIRLLRLKPCHSPDALLEAEMITTDLESAPKFIAISHDWETSGTPRMIILEGREFLISNELDSALRQLRRVSEGSYVWVDFLSIHQLDLDERASQTNLLPYIYGSADYVFVWLGEIKGDFVRILNALSRIKIPPFITELPGLYVEIIRSLLDIEGAIESVRGFLESQWWKRIWMIQPFVLAKSLELYTGTAMIEWEVFGKAIKVLHAYVFLTPASSEVRQTAAFQQILPLIQNVHEISMLREWHRLDDDSSPAIARAKDYLLYCLWLLYSREYSDARDIIYTACMLAQRNAPILRLSYRSTIREVYHDAAVAIITYYGDLKLLSHTLFSRRRHESRKANSDVPIDPSYYWPSWVPDWRLRPWGLGSTTFDLSDFVLSPQLVFNACGGLKAQFIFSDNSKILNVVGVQVGRINKVFRATEAHDSVDPVRQQSPDTDWGLLRLTPPLGQQQYIAGGSWAAAWINTCEIMDRESYPGTGKRTLRLPENGFENVLRSMNYHGQRPPETVTNDTGTYQYGSPEPLSWDGINVILKPQRVKTPRGESFVEERFHLISLDSGHVGFGGYAVREGDFMYTAS